MLLIPNKVLADGVQTLTVHNIQVNIIKINKEALIEKMGVFFTLNPKPLKHMVKQNNAIGGINANFFNMNTLRPCGVLVIDGKVISKNIYNRPYWVLLDNGESFITDQDLNTLPNIKYAVGGGNYLVKDGKQHITQPHFTKTFMNNPTRKTIIGIDKWNNLCLITIRYANMYSASKILLKLHIKDAICMDGGTSSQMYYKGKYIMYSERRVPVVLLVK